MKERRVLRWYCDYCKKSGCSKGHMVTHEAHCTMNPNRTCRLCEEVSNPSPAELAAIVAETKKALAAVPRHVNGDDHGEWTYVDEEALRKVVSDVKDATETCPACTLAVLRQAGADMGDIGVTGWTFKEELKSWWADANEGMTDYGY